MAIASTVYAASLCLVMLFCMRAMVRVDLRPELGAVGAYLTKATCYTLSVIFLVGFVVETVRLAVAA